VCCAVGADADGGKISCAASRVLLLWGACLI